MPQQGKRKEKLYLIEKIWKETTNICVVSLKMPKGVVIVYLWWGRGYCLPVSGSCAYTAYESSSSLGLPPAPVPLSLFCTFPKYTACHWMALTLLAPGGGLVPTTSLDLAHAGVAGQVIKQVPVGLERVCCCSGLSLLGELRPGWWGWMRAVGRPIWECGWWSGKGFGGGDNLHLSLPYSWSAKEVSLLLNIEGIWWRRREGHWPLHALGLVELILSLSAPKQLLPSTPSQEVESCG